MNLNKIFSSHMVFARQLPVRIYGEGAGRVEICFAGHKKTLISDEDKWMVEFPPMEYGGPYSMEVNFADRKIVLVYNDHTPSPLCLIIAYICSVCKKSK